MNQSRSLDQITSQFMSNSDMEDLSPNDRKFILSQLKKMYSQEMGKVASQLTRRNQVKSNKSDIQHKEQLEIKSIHENVLKKMQQHNQKRQKVFKKRLNHFKLLDENWKLKLEQIQRKKKEQYKQSLEKAAQYRKQAQTFWSTNRQKNKSIAIDHTVPVIENEGYFSIKTQIRSTSNKLLKPQAEEFYQKKKKSQSKNELPNIVKSLLPTIQKKNCFPSQSSKKNDEGNNSMNQSFHRLADDKIIKEHIEKSNNLNTQKEEMALQKALEKLKMIELKRKKCRQNRQKSIKEAKIKRQLRQETIANASRSKRLEDEENYPSKSSKQKRTQRKSIQSLDGTLSLSKSKNSGFMSLNQSIVKHQKAKQELEAQKFEERGEVLKANIMKQKKGKMMRKVKETINKLKCEALKDC